MNKQYPLFVRITIFLLFTTLFFHGLVMAREFLYPIAIAVLFSGLLYPLVRLLEQYRFPRVAAILTAILAGVLVIGGLVYLLGSQLSVFVDNFESIKSKAGENIHGIQQFMKRNIGIETDSENGTWPLNNINSMMGDIFSATTGTLVKIGLQPVYVFFFLYYREKFNRFIYKIVPDRKHETLGNIIRDFSLIAKNYVGGLFVVVLILCVLNSLGLWIIGLKYALLFGILSAIMNFIPYFGTLIGASIPLTYAFLVDSPSRGLYVAVFFLVIQFTENNILTPRITGGYVNINPIITILGIIVGGMVWGIPGMFLSVPALAVLKTICANIESLNPIAYLLDRK